MPLLQVALSLIVAGVLCWLVDALIPVAQAIKAIVYAVAIIVAILGVLVFLSSCVPFEKSVLADRSRCTT